MTGHQGAQGHGLKAPERFFINGDWVAPTSDRRIDVISPVTEERLLRYPEATPADIDRAIAAARAAFDSGPWPRMAPAERAGYLRRVASLISARLDEIARAWTTQVGAPISLTKKLVGQNATLFSHYAELIETHPFLDRRRRDDGGEVRVLREPVGVCAAISPWNAPMVLLSYKIAAGLAAGCTMVAKPSPETPLEAYILAECIEQAGLPRGVFNLVPAGREGGEHLVRHAGIDKVAFTGSTAVGKQIQRSVAGSGKRVTLELGGKAANIIFDDAAIDQAVEGIVDGIFFNQGHVCCAGSRLLVQENVHDLVVERLTARLSTLRVGDPLDKNTDLGAINSAEQLERIRALTDAGEAEGATRWELDCPLPERGFWFRPTVFTDVSTSARIAREEIFGPVLSVMTFRTPDEAIAKANNTPYGLSAGIWTEKGSRILNVADRLRAGVVWANTFNRFDPASPFGGYKESGFGREGGRHGLAAYLRPASTETAA